MKKKLASVFMASTIFAGMLAGCGTAKEGSGENSDTIKLGVNLRDFQVMLLLMVNQWQRELKWLLMKLIKAAV